MKTSFALTHPNLATQWHPTLNGDLIPEMVTPGSGKKVWWLGECGHEWDAIIAGRSGKRLGCPYCSGHRVLAGFNDLATINPEIVKFWHPTKNGDLTPEMVTVGSKNYAWWVCKIGHNVQATIHAFNKSQSCPMCDNREVLPNFNDLAFLSPTLAAQWHPTLNGNLTPQMVTNTSNKIVWWLCSEGHEWKATIYSRKKNKCPVCGGRKVWTGKTDLATLRPDVASIWHPTKNGALTPQQVTPFSKLMVWWLGNCDHKHEWQGQITHIQKGQGKCVVCFGRKLEKGFNDLATTHPKIASEWHPALNGDLTPEKATQGSGKKVWWLGECGHEWDATISSRATQGVGCAVCSGKKVLPGYNDLATTRPEIAAQWHPTLNGTLTPQHVPRGTTKKVWWQCSKGHEWQAQVNDRNSGRGCSVCANKQVLPGFNDLATKHPELAAEWHPTKNGELMPQEVVSGSHLKAWWLGKCGHEWQAQVNGRNNGNGCPVCANRQIHVGYNDLATTHPHVAALWHPTLNGNLTPHMVTASNGTTVWWLGNCGLNHEWQSRIAYMGKGQEKCLVCIGQRIQTGYNDLATTRPDLAAQWHPTKNETLTPHMVMPGSSKRVWWQCSKGHEWNIPIKNRSTKGTGCPVCSNNVILAGYNDLATTHPAVAAQWHPSLNENLTPTNITAGSHKKVWWLGNCGHEWFSHIRSHIKGHGCPTCIARATISHGEQEIADYVASLGFHFIQSDHSQIHKELDLYLPQQHIAIEYNGLYYHSEAKGIKTNYHHEKWLRCTNKGVQLIQIWEDDWLNKPELVKRLLADKLGEPKESLVQAQQTFIATIAPQEAQTFLDKTHLQGQAKGSHYLGLRSKETNILIAVMVLAKHGLTLEIVRYATNCQIPDGFTKLLKHVTTTFQPSQIIVFDDHCISDSGLYAQNGFTAEKELAPDYWYFVNNQRVNKSEYPPERFKNDPKLQWVEGMAETQLATLNGLHRIYDAGKTRWTKTIA